MAEQKYGMSLKELEKLENKSKEEKMFYGRYRRYMPLLNNSCTMNILSHYVEEMEFDNKWKTSVDGFDYHILMSGNFEIDDVKLINNIKKIIKDFNHSQKINALNREYAVSSVSDDEEINDNIYGYLFEYYESKLLDLCSNQSKLTDYVVYVFYNYFNKQSKSLMWNIFGDQILKNIKNSSNKVCFPIRDENGTEYLGERYSLKEVDVSEL